MSVTSEAAAAEAVESLADTAEDLEIDVEAGESSSEEEEEGGKVLEPIAEGEERREEENTAADEEDNDNVEDGESSESENGEKEIEDKTEVKEEPLLPEFPDTDVKIQYDR
jgi:hypothetical protein